MCDILASPNISRLTTVGWFNIGVMKSRSDSTAGFYEMLSLKSVDTSSGKNVEMHTS